MSFQNAAALFWLLPLGGIVILLYLLKMRRRDVRVPATFLWPARVEEIRANALFQKLKPSWLLFLQLTDRARLGVATAEKAYAAWRTNAPSAAEAELREMLRFLGKFLWLTRLIGRVHMGSDLRRFLAATGYLSEVLLASPRPADASKAGKDD